MDRARFAPEFALFIGGQPVPADLRASIPCAPRAMWR